MVHRFAMEDTSADTRGKFPAPWLYPGCTSEGQSALSAAFVGADATSRSGQSMDKIKDAAVAKIRAAYPVPAPAWLPWMTTGCPLLPCPYL